MLFTRVPRGSVCPITKRESATRGWALGPVPTVGLVDRLGPAIGVPEPAAVAADKHGRDPVGAATGRLAGWRVPVVPDRAHPRRVALDVHLSLSPLEAERLPDLDD